MKKISKKIVFVLSFCAITCLVASLFGCGRETSDEEKNVSVEISFPLSERALTVGDEEYLFPVYQKTEGYVLSYSSSDPTVVKVDTNGKLSAEGEGSATVTATYSNGINKAEASIKVNSSFNGFLPELKTMGVSDEIAITLNDGYKILPYVVFNGKQFGDMTVSYRVSDKAIADVNEKGEIKAKAKGKTEIIIESFWRGKGKSDAPTMQKTVYLTVIDDVRFYNGDLPVNDETLYTCAEFEGNVYQNSIPCDFKVLINGDEKVASVTIEDENVIKRQGNLLTVKSFGSTSVLLQTTEGETTYSKTFTVTVKRVEKEVTEIIPLFSTIDGLYTDVTDNTRKTLLSFVNDNDEIIDAYQGVRPLKVNAGKISDVISSSDTKRGVAEIDVGTKKTIYHFKLETLAKCICVKEDIKALELSAGKTLNGYYELIGDIDATGINLNHDVSNEACFSGVFNGNGHSISNLSLNRNSSLFGVLNSTAKVQNLALLDLNATEAYFLAQNTLNDGVTISDVYIRLSQSTVTPRGITGRTGSLSVYKNVVIEYLGSNANANRNYRERYTWQGLVGGMWTTEKDGMLYARDEQWKDVYVISPFVVSFRSDDKKDGNNYAAIYGYGANEVEDIYGNQLDVSEKNRDNPYLGDYWQTTVYYNALYTNLYHYADYDALKSQSRDFSAFSSDYWITFDNKVIWKPSFESDLEIKFFDSETGADSDSRIAGLNKELNVKALFDGTEAEISEVYLEDNDYVVWDDKNKVFRSISLPVSGLAEVEVNITVKIGETELTKSVGLMVTGEIVNVSKIYDFIDEKTGKMAGEAFPMNEIVGSSKVLSVYQGAKQLTYDKEQGVLSGLTANVEGEGENRKVEPVVLTISTANKVYVVNVKVYSKVISTANDLKYFNQSLSENANNTYDGYYILTENIKDFTSVYNDVSDTAAGLKPFNGTFDGNGHSISAKVNKGIFGILGNGSVVKNTAFTDMQVAVDNAYQLTAIVAGYISNSTDVAVLKDLYITIDETVVYPYRQYLSKWFTTAMLVSNNASLKSKFSNIVIEANILHGDYNAKGGAQPCLFRYWSGINNSAKGGEYAQNTAIDSLTDVYVISKDKTNSGGLFRVTAGLDKDATQSMALSYNDYIVVSGSADSYTKLYLPSTYNDGKRDRVTMRRYDDYTAMANDKNDYSSFNSKCWKLSGDTPIWINK